MSVGMDKVLIVTVASESTDLQASVTFVLIGAVFASLLVPMLVSLFFFSTGEFRRRGLFYLNAFALVFGIAQGVLLTALYVRSILEPQANLFGGSLAVNIVFLFSPLLVESILLLRLVTVFPSRVHGRRTLFAVLALPVLVRIGRLVNMCLAIAWLGAASTGLRDNMSQWWALLPYVRAEWLLALVDNAYVSLVFLYRLQMHAPIAQQRTNAMALRVRRLFFIAVSNFILPGVLNFVQIVLIFTLPNPSDPPARQAQVFYVCAYIMIVFNYVCVIGVVFATIWSTGSSWASEWASMSEGSRPSTSKSEPTTPRQSGFNPQFRAVPTEERASVDTQRVPLIGGAPMQ
jgi:hypothetical protein